MYETRWERLMDKLPKLRLSIAGTRVLMTILAFTVVVDTVAIIALVVL